MEKDKLDFISSNLFFFSSIFSRTKQKLRSSLMIQSSIDRNVKQHLIKCNTLTELLKGEKNRTEMETAKQNLLEKTNK